MTFKEQLLYRAKAIITACGAIIGTALVAVIVDPTTEHAIVAVIPAQFQVLAALVFGAIVTALVHRVPNVGSATVAPDAPVPVTELPERVETSFITLPTSSN
jgi:predicted transcriptional regulator